MTGYASPRFKLKLYRHENNQVVISMQFTDDCWMTNCLPETLTFLRSNQPSVFECECQNDNNHSFVEEVKHTELAHLFEHLVIDHMCQQKAEQKDAEFIGETEWNWFKYPIGSFKVTLQIKDEDLIYLQPALIDSVNQLESLLNTRHKNPSLGEG